MFANHNDDKLTTVIVYFPFLTRWAQQEGGKPDQAREFPENLDSCRESESQVSRQTRMMNRQLAGDVSVSFLD